MFKQDLNSFTTSRVKSVSLFNEHSLASDIPQPMRAIKACLRPVISVDSYSKGMYTSYDLFRA